jgi:hypothetical protein
MRRTAETRNTLPFAAVIIFGINQFAMATHYQIKHDLSTSSYILNR